ncbi:MAG: right-handed parallel beta-helix repeat-containing protein [Candidatus Eisenbacteria sp.]|nr:right-handed parallel beta-helix repeat-containing protein [Candidatus Eisenbacteria bacterium]
MKSLVTVFSCAFVLATCSASQAVVWNVPTDVPTIQAGIDSASAGDTVLVACGTYYEHDIAMKSGVVLRSETGQPDCVTIDADQLGRVLYCDNVDGTATIEGFTITNGLVGGYGGGLYCGNSFLTIADCVFSANSADDGGGMYCSNCSPTLTHCDFSENSATDFWGRGGGVHCEDADAVFINCTFYGNSARMYGAGLSCKTYSSPVLTGCTFHGNEGSMYGGGVSSEYYCSPGLTSCVFYGNSASFGGGGVFCWDYSSATLTSCTFSGNSAGEAGGGVFCAANSSLTVQNTIIAFNNNGGAAVCDGTSGATLACCDLYGNTGGDWTGCVADQLGILGNISEDPLFCNPGADDFRLAPGSPCAPMTSPNPQCSLIGCLGVGCGDWEGIMSITDVPGDQGGQVRVTWTSHDSDNPGSLEPIVEYSLWRRIDEWLKAEYGEPQKSTRGSLRYPPGSWEYVLTVPALGESTYTAISPTMCDSTIAEGLCWSVLYLTAQTESPDVYYECEPDSGYSVDNLEPAAPQNLTAERDSASIVLSWDPVPEEDFKYYTVYRGDEEDFQIDEPIGYSPAESYTDNDLPGPGDYWYKVTATDFAGNESEPSLSASAGTLGVGDPGGTVPTLFYLGPATPNPFNPLTEISYGIPAGTAPSHVVMQVFDTLGREVTALVDADHGPGTHSVVWDGRDWKGAAVASGVYFYRITWNGRSETKRMVLLK